MLFILYLKVATTICGCQAFGVIIFLLDLSSGNRQVRAFGTTKKERKENGFEQDDGGYVLFNDQTAPSFV
jgi:hypothetical protein